MNTKLNIREKPKPAVQVNKTVVLFSLAILLFLVIWAITAALTETSGGKKVNKEKVNVEKTSEMSSAIKDIPANYSDMNIVAKYAGGLENSNYEALQREVQSLKSEDENLEQQLIAITQAKQPRTKIEDAGSMQARSSNLFFSGIGSDQPLQFGGGGGMIQNIPSMPGQQTQQPVGPVTPQQVNYFKQQGENTQKLAVAKAQDNPEDIYDLHNMVTPVSPYEVQAGTIIPAVLITKIDTSVQGTVVAQVRQSVFDTVSGKYLLIPKGAKLLGEYETRGVSYGQTRVLISFNRIIRPDGSSILLGKPYGADLQGAGGLTGSVDNHWARILGAATISTILSIGAGVASDNNANTNTNYINARQGAILGAATGVSNVGQSIVNRSLDIPPTITVPAGYEFNVIVKKDMVLTPYKSN